MTQILLDTCAAIYLVEGTLPQRAQQALSDAYAAGAPALISPITGWEIGLLAANGRFKSSYSPQRWLERLLDLPGIDVAPLPPRVLMDSWLLPGEMNRDPADRILAATAREYGYVLMTRDRQLLGYAHQGHLRALPC